MALYDDSARGEAGLEQRSGRFYGIYNDAVLCFADFLSNSATKIRIGITATNNNKNSFLGDL